MDHYNIAITYRLGHVGPQGLVYSHMEQALGDGEWLIARLKAELSTPNPNHSHGGCRMYSENFRGGKFQLIAML